MCAVGRARGRPKVGQPPRPAVEWGRKAGGFNMRLPLGIVGLVSGVGALGCAGAPPPPSAPAPPPVSVFGSNEGTVLGDVDGGALAASEAGGAPASPDAGVAAAPVTVVARNLHASAALAVDLNAIYWVDEVGGEVARAPKRGGLTMTLYGGNGGGFSPGSSIAVEGGDVYSMLGSSSRARRTPELAHAPGEGRRQADRGGLQQRCAARERRGRYAERLLGDGQFGDEGAEGRGAR